jgi:hypothetical protein
MTLKVPAFAKRNLRKFYNRVREISPEYQFQEAYRRYQLGYLRDAGEKYCSLLTQYPRNEKYVSALAELKKEVMRCSNQRQCGWKLVWQVQPGKIWERHWIRTLLSGINFEEVIDTNYSEIHPRMIVVDHLIQNSKKLISEQKQKYYANTALNGSQLVLYHIGDEIYNHDCTVYRLCDFVIRNYWSISFDTEPNVMAVPIGYKAGFETGRPVKPASSRRYIWSFMGDMNKGTRQKMLEELRKLGSGFEHLISGWNSADSLPIEKYREVMDDTIFVPCPAGWGNLDSFRVYEALEAGCIPVLEKRDYDYFNRLLGENPLPTVSDWAGVSSILQQLSGGDRWETHRSMCANWWEQYKKTLQARVTGKLKAL